MNPLSFVFGGPGAVPWRARLRRARAQLAFRSIEKRRDLYDKLAQFSEDGLSPKEAISLIHDRRADRGDISAVMTGEWLNRLGASRSLADSMAPWIPPIETVLIAVGESTGRLAESLTEVTTLATRRHDLVKVTRQHMRKALTAWALVTSIVLMIAQVVAPKLRLVLPPSKWSFNQSLYFHVMHGTERVLPYALVVLACLLFWAFWSRPRWVGPRRAFFDRFPPWSLYRKVEGAWLLVALATLMLSNVAPVDALKRIKRFSAPYVRQHLGRMILRMESGKREGEAMDTGMLSQEMVDDLMDYQSSAAGFAKGVDRLGRQAVDKTGQIMTAAAASIEAIAWFVLLGVMLWTISAIGGIVISALSSAQFL